MRHFHCQKVSKQHSNAGIYRVPDLVQFDQVQTPELVPVHLSIYYLCVCRVVFLIHCVMSSVVVLEESPRPRGSVRTSYQVLVLAHQSNVFVGPSVLVTVLKLQKSTSESDDQLNLITNSPITGK